MNLDSNIKFYCLLHNLKEDLDHEGSKLLKEHLVDDSVMSLRVKWQILNPIIQSQELDHLLTLSIIVLQHLDAIELLSNVPSGMKSELFCEYCS